MFYIYLYIFICLLIFWNDSGNFKNLQPLFLADFGSFLRIFMYTRCIHGTFLIQNNLKSCFMPLEPQILSLCIISKSLGKFRVIESIHGIVRVVDGQPFHWIRSVSNRLTYVLRSQHDI